jgi:hypothetical protein
MLTCFCIVYVNACNAICYDSGVDVTLSYISMYVSTLAPRIGNTCSVYWTFQHSDSTSNHYGQYSWHILYDVSPLYKASDHFI